MFKLSNGDGVRAGTVSPGYAERSAVARNQAGGARAASNRLVAGARRAARRGSLEGRPDRCCVVRPGGRRKQPHCADRGLAPGAGRGAGRGPRDRAEALRRVAGGEPGGDRWIETMPRRGYRFIGPVLTTEQNDATVRSEPAPKSSMEAAPALPSKPSIAVLPFQNLSGDPEQEYFADGMLEDIITGLSRIKWLFVIARNSC